MPIGSISNALISAAWSNTSIRATTPARRDTDPITTSDNTQPTESPERTDAVEISDEAREAAANSETDSNAEPRGADGEPLTEEEQEVVEELRQRDQEVRTHEQAHVAAGGQYVTGGPNYSYQRGPDGNRYAVGGEVSIDASPVHGDPEATIRKMAVIRAAALAPAEPSSQDRAVAAAAAQHAAKAQAELAQTDTDSSDTETSEAAPQSDAESTTGGPYGNTADTDAIGALIDIAA